MHRASDAPRIKHEKMNCLFSKNGLQKALIGGM